MLNNASIAYLIVNPGKFIIFSPIIVKTKQQNPNRIETTPHTINLQNTSFLYEIGTVSIFFIVSLSYSLFIIYPEINVIQTGNINVILFLITCSYKYLKSQNDPSFAVEVNIVSTTDKSIIKIPDNIILYLFNFKNSVFIIVIILLTSLSVYVIN